MSRFYVGIVRLGATVAKTLLFQTIFLYLKAEELGIFKIKFNCLFSLGDFAHGRLACHTSACLLPNESHTLDSSTSFSVCLLEFLFFRFFERVYVNRCLFLSASQFCNYFS